MKAVLIIIVQSDVVNPNPLVPWLFLVGLETVGLAIGLCKRTYMELIEKIGSTQILVGLV